MAAEGDGNGGLPRRPRLSPANSDGVSLARAIEKFRSFHDSDQGFIETVAFGKRAVPALRELLFAQEPSGLFQTRCLAAKALGVLEAYDTLIEFLGIQREVADPTERLGEDAVINAAARALAGSKDEQVFDLLVRLAESHLLPGVLAGLGALRRPEAVPYLVAGLGEDECRAAAEAALRNLGPLARNSLLAVVAERPPQPESQSSLRKRRSAIGLLTEIGVPSHAWPALRDAIRDRDSKIAARACMIALTATSDYERSDAARRLVGFAGHADAALRIEIEQCLAKHFDSASIGVGNRAPARRPEPEDTKKSPPSGILTRTILLLRDWLLGTHGL